VEEVEELEMVFQLVLQALQEDQGVDHKVFLLEEQETHHQLVHHKEMEVVLLFLEIQQVEEVVVEKHMKEQQM
jgi:hypothetical protein